MAFKGRVLVRDALPPRKKDDMKIKNLEFTVIFGVLLVIVILISGCIDDGNEKQKPPDNTTSPPNIIWVKEETNKITAKIVDDTGVVRAVLHIGIRVPPSYPIIVREDGRVMDQEGEEVYSAKGIPNDAHAQMTREQLVWYYIEATDKNGNTVTSRKFIAGDINHEII